jgi:serine/threonine protein kinase/WD40 repeat protein
MSSIDPIRRAEDSGAASPNNATPSTHASPSSHSTPAGSSKHDVLVDLLDAALAMTPDERARFLDGLAARHEDRARELRELLEALPDPEYPTDTITPVEQASGSAAGLASNKSHDDSHDPYVGEPLVGELLGGCRLTSVLGRGGIGTVFAAEQVEPPRPVAVKVLRAASARASHVRRFQTEAAALARLEHPAIVRIYASGIARREGLELPYIVMERVTDATNFVDWARASARSLRETVACLTRICDGMQHGHRRGLIHRDLKPTNILVAADGTPRIIDFGVARIFGDDSPRAQETLAGALIGTPAYMAPEQFELSSAEVDTRVDIHALGTILYEALAGRRAYEIPRHLYFDAARILRATEPVALDRIDRNIPRDLAAIVAKAMAKDREKRYATMAEFAEDLRAFLDGRAVRARPESRGERAIRWIRRNPAWATAITATAIAMLASTIFTTISWQRSSHQLMLASLARAATASINLETNTTKERLAEVREIAGQDVPAFIYGFLESPFESNTLPQGPIAGSAHRYTGSLSPDRTRWIATGDGPQVLVLDIASGSVLRAEVPNAPSFTWACGFNGDGSRTLVGCENGLYEVTEDGRCVPIFEQSIGQVRAISPNPVDAQGFYFFPGSQAIYRFPFASTPAKPDATLGAGGGLGTLSLVGRRMYAAAADASIYAFDVRDDGSLERDMAFQPPVGRGIALSCSPDGEHVARGLYQGAVEVLDAKTGERFARTFIRHEVKVVAFSPSGAFLFVGDRGGRIHRYRVDRDESTGSVRELIPAGMQRLLNPDPVWALGPLDDEIVVANIGQTIVRLDFTPRWSSAPKPFPDAIVHSVSRFDGRRIRAVGDSGMVRELDLATGAWTDVAKVIVTSRNVTFSPDGETTVTWDGNTIRVWSLPAMPTPASASSASAATELKPVEIPATGSFDRVAFAWKSDGTQLAIALEQRVFVVDRAGLVLADSQVPLGIVHTLVWSAPGQLFATSSNGQHIRTDLSIQNGEIIASKPESGSFYFTNANGRVVHFGLGGEIFVYPRGGTEVLRGVPAQMLKGHTDVVTAVSITEAADDEWVATGGEDGTVRVWRLSSGDCYLTTPPAEARIRSVQWAPDGRSLLSIDHIGNVRFLDSLPRRERLLQAANAEQ